MEKKFLATGVCQRRKGQLDRDEQPCCVEPGSREPRASDCRRSKTGMGGLWPFQSILYGSKTPSQNFLCMRRLLPDVLLGT